MIRVVTDQLGYEPGHEPKPHTYGTVNTLTSFWLKDGHVYRTLGIITDPAVIIEDVVTGERETHVIHSRTFAAYTHLSPKGTTR